VTATASPLIAPRRGVSVHTEDLDEGVALVAGLYTETRHQVLGRGSRYEFEGSGIELERLRLNRTRFGALTRVTPGTPRDFHVVNFSRAMRMGVGGGFSPRIVASQHLSGVVMSASEPAYIDHTQAPMLGLVLPVEEVARELRSILGSEPPEPVVFEPQIDLSDPGAASLYRLVRFLYEELNQEQSLLAAPLALAEAERMLRSGVVRNLRHSYSERLAAGSEPATLLVVRRVEEYLDAHANEPIDSEVLARVAGCSASAVYKAFRRHRDQTPIQLLRSVRMERARQSLLGPDPASTVTGIALEWGFAHLGRFSVEYRERFGECPSQTLRRAQSQNPDRPRPASG
jgi:AraC-like DNA-binding protein